MSEDSQVPEATVDDQPTIELERVEPAVAGTAYSQSAGTQSTATESPGTGPTGIGSPDNESAGDADERRGPLHYVWQIVSWALLIGAFALLCVTILIPKIAGAQTYTVLTGSMKPNYPPGTLIVVKPEPTEEIRVNDVITYQIRSGSPDVVTHRVIEVTEDDEGETRFITQGDNNGAPDDEPVRPVQVRGTLWYSVPYIGWVNNWLTSERRTKIIFGLAGALFVYGAWQFVADYRDRKYDDDPDEAEPGLHPEPEPQPGPEPETTA